MSAPAYVPPVSSPGEADANPNYGDGGGGGYGGGSPSYSSPEPEPAPEPTGRWYVVDTNTGRVFGNAYSYHDEAYSKIGYSADQGANNVKDLAGKIGWEISGTKYYELPSWARSSS